MRNLFLLLLLVPAMATADSELVTGRAAPLEVYEKVREAARYLSEAGEAGLKEFENPRGRFVWKNAFVWVTQCDELYCLPGPKANNIGINISKAKCYQTGKLYILNLCFEAKDNPNGAWVEYWWPKQGYEKPQRRVSYMRQVPGTPYQVVAGTFDDQTSLDALNDLIK
ncbi:hypothetical protein D3OALGA1CA_5398 [Olavius algarvensis associated proteobacterium Delta 3]|nr:hypothetical protein D3OALGB2SA_1544 [Olavius algarvensis associated proteobacterium Delta 3]CAB5166129.1 hypothetical protein D3OALGA1CA_5398 [Olavius algarvensis associated proteobacterium Delta 3]